MRSSLISRGFDNCGSVAGVAVCARLLKAALLVFGAYMSAAKTRNATAAVGHIHTGAMVVNRVNEIAAHIGVNGGAKLVHPGGAKLVRLTLCGTRCWGVVPVVHRRDPRCFE